MNHSRVRAAVVAALAALLATVVLAGPAAGAVASVSTGSQVAENPTTHRFAVDDPRTGPLEAVELRYDSDADLDDAEVTVGVDGDGDGDIDDRLRTTDETRTDRAVGVAVAPVDLAADDAVVVVVEGVRNPTTVGDHGAIVGTTVGGATERSTATYRVTPFRSDDTEFWAVEIPGSEFDRTYATGSSVVDARFTGVDWRGVTLADATLQDIEAVDDDWSGVEFDDTAASTLRTERTEFTDVRFAGTAVAGLEATDDRWRNVDAVDSRLRGVDSTDSTYRDVRFESADVAGLEADSSTLAGVAVTPATAETSDRPPAATGGGASGDDLTASASVGADFPSVSDDRADDAVADARGSEGQAPNRTVADVTLEDATLRDVTVADGALVDVTMEETTLRNVTLDNVTLRGVTLGDDVYADATLSDEIITSETELRQELAVDAADSAAPNAVDAGAEADLADGEVDVDDGGATDDVDPGADAPTGDESGDGTATDDVDDATGGLGD